MNIIKAIKTVGLILIGLTSFSTAAQQANNTYKIKSTSTFDSVDYAMTVISGKVISEWSGTSIYKISFQKHDDIGNDLKNAYVNDDGTYVMRMPPEKGVLYAQTVLGHEIILPVRDYKINTTVEIDFYSNDSLTPLEPREVTPITPPSVSFKPVIYLYNDHKIDVTLDLDYLGELTFTYPKYENNWEVSVDENGIIHNDRSYPYLFWEGEMNGLKFNRNTKNQIPSRIVKKKDVVSVLEKELTGMGLNATEMTDFITFWGPRLEQHDKVAIQFLRNSDYTKKVASLSVTPTPQTVNRIYLLYTPINDSNENQFVEVRTKYEKFVRSGFTLIEWGGSEISTVENMEIAKRKKQKRNVQVCGTFANSSAALNELRSK